MSGELSRARSTGPFVQIVPSAIWFGNRGFFSDRQLELEPRGIVQVLVELPEFSLA